MGLRQLAEADLATTLEDSVGGFGWMGLNDHETEGTFVWSDGDSSTYRNWADGEPNDENDEDCGLMQANLDYKWNDAKCGLETIGAVICQSR